MVGKILLFQLSLLKLSCSASHDPYYFEVHPKAPFPHFGWHICKVSFTTFRERIPRGISISSLGVSVINEEVDSAVYWYNDDFLYPTVDDLIVTVTSIGKLSCYSRFIDSVLVIRQRNSEKEICKMEKAEILDIWNQKTTHTHELNTLLNHIRISTGDKLIFLLEGSIDNLIEASNFNKPTKDLRDLLHNLSYAAPNRRISALSVELSYIMNGDSCYTVDNRESLIARLIEQSWFGQFAKSRFAVEVSTGETRVSTDQEDSEYRLLIKGISPEKEFKLYGEFFSLEASNHSIKLSNEFLLVDGIIKRGPPLRNIYNYLQIKLVGKNKLILRQHNNVPFHVSIVRNENYKLLSVAIPNATQKHNDTLDAKFGKFLQDGDMIIIESKSKFTQVKSCSKKRKENRFYKMLFKNHQMAVKIVKVQNVAKELSWCEL